MDPRQNYSNALCSGHSEATVRAVGLREIPLCFLGGWAAMSSFGVSPRCCCSDEFRGWSGAELKDTAQHSPSDTAAAVGKKALTSLGGGGTAAAKSSLNCTELSSVHQSWCGEDWAGPIHTERVRKGRLVWLQRWWSHIPEQFFPESGLESCNWCNHPEWVL